MTYHVTFAIKNFKKSFNLKRHKLDVHKFKRNENRIESGSHFFILEDDDVPSEIKQEAFAEAKESLGIQFRVTLVMAVLFYKTYTINLSTRSFFELTINGSIIIRTLFGMSPRVAKCWGSNPPGGDISQHNAGKFGNLL